MKWFKNIMYLLRHFKTDIESLNREVTSLRSRVVDMENMVRSHTDIGVDVNFRSHNHVIVVGRYKNIDYVQTYSLDGNDFSRTIEQLKQMEKLGTVRIVDAPPQITSFTKRMLGQ